MDVVVVRGGCGERWMWGEGDESSTQRKLCGGPTKDFQAARVYTARASS